MSASSVPLALPASATGGITVAVLITIGLVAVAVVTLHDRTLWNPFAQAHGLQRSGTIDPTSWGEPFRTEFGTEIPFSGAVDGIPLTIAEYWHALDYDTEGDVKGKRRIQVCVLRLAAAQGRLHIRNHHVTGPLAHTVESGGRPIGHHGFDHRYGITVDDPQLRASLLTPPVVDFLATAPDVAAVRVVGDQLVVVGAATRRSRDKLETLYQVAAGLAVRLPAGVVRGQWAA